MRVVTNQRFITRRRGIAQVLFIVSLVILIGAFVVNLNLIKVPDFIAIFVPLVALPIGLVTTIVSVRMTNLYVRTPHSEDAIREGLKGANKRDTLYNYLLPAPHVLVTQQGVYSFTTRFQDTPFKVEGDKWYNPKGRGPLAPLSLFFKQESLGDPFGQAKREAAGVQALVDKALPNAGIVVQPAVVFTSPKTTLEVIDPTIPVVYADSKKKPALKGLLKEDKKKDNASLLSLQQLQTLDNAFLAIVGAANPESQLEEDEA
jgi:hypothetical protein